MRRVLPIAKNTLRQTIRDRLFVNVAIFGVGMLLFAMVIAQITFGFPDRVVRSIGLSGVAMAADLMALLLGVNAIHQEIDRKTLFVVLTRPVTRAEYVLGRYLGLVATLGLALLGLAVVFAVVLSSVRGTFSAKDAIALLMILPEAMVIAGVGVVLSCFSTPTVSAGIGIGVWIAGATTDDLVRLSAGADGFTRAVAKGVYYLLPSLSRFNFREAAVHAKTIPLEQVAPALLYGGLYAAALVALASLVLSRREMV